MITCRSCGFGSDLGSTFCDSCGTFLEWTGERRGAPAEPDAGRGAADTAGRAGASELVFSSDFAHGETGLRARVRDDGAQARVDEPDQPTAAMVPDAQDGEDSATAGGTDVEDDDQSPDGDETDLGPPAPPRTIHAPPPVTLSVRPPDLSWDAPAASTNGDGPPPDAATLRVLARGADTVMEDLPVVNRARRPIAVEVQLEPPATPGAAGRTDELQSIGPSLPGRQHSFDPKPRPPAPLASRRMQPGDVVCTGCKEANLPSRAFCRRCGDRLPAAPHRAVTTSGPWWRRWWPADDDEMAPPRRYRAGERPAELQPSPRGEPRWRVLWRRLQRAGRTGSSYLVSAMAALALLATVLPQAAPLRQNALEWLEGVGEKVQRTLVPQFAPVHPVAVRASSSRAGHPPESIVDGFSNRFWVDGDPGDGVGTLLEFVFEEPVVLARMAVFNGGVEEGEEYNSQPRPRRITVTFDGEAAREIELLDEHLEQQHNLRSPPTTTVVVRIDSVYGAIGDGHDTAIREIAFLRRL